MFSEITDNLNSGSSCVGGQQRHRHTMGQIFWPAQSILHAVNAAKQTDSSQRQLVENVSCMRGSFQLMGSRQRWQSSFCVGCPPLPTLRGGRGCIGTWRGAAKGLADGSSATPDPSLPSGHCIIITEEGYTSRS